MNTPIVVNHTNKSSGQNRAKGEFAKLAAASIVAGVVLGAVGVVPTLRLAGQPGLGAMAAGIGVSILGSIVAAIPLAFSRDPSPASRQVAFLGAIASRMFVTLILFAVVVLSHVVANKPFTVWTGLSYLVLLCVETWTAIR